MHACSITFLKYLSYMTIRDGRNQGDMAFMALEDILSSN